MGYELNRRLYEIGKKISNAHNMEDLFLQVQKCITEDLCLERFLVFYWKEDHPQLLTSHGYGKSDSDPLAKVSWRLDDPLLELLIAYDGKALGKGQSTPVEFANQRAIWMMEEFYLFVLKGIQGRKTLLVVAGNSVTPAPKCSPIEAGSEAHLFLGHLTNLLSMALMKGEASSLAREEEQKIRELEQENEKVLGLLNNMKQAVFTFGEDGVVVAPVSSYSREIFDLDIVGLNVFDFLYKSIEEKSEAYSLLKTAIVSVFGSDELQWMVMAGNFPGTLEYVVDGFEIKVKKLRISYNPIWDQENNLFRLSLVVEDITEVQMLEAEIQKEKQENAGRMLILQELAALNPKDLKKLFSNLFNLIESSLLLLKKRSISKEQGGELFRNLHTIKGNSRMFALSKLSQVTHEVESNFSEICDQTDTNGNYGEGQILSIQEGVKGISSVAREYAHYAEKLFKIENENRMHHMTLLHQTMIRLEWCLYQILREGAPVSNLLSGPIMELLSAVTEHARNLYDNEAMIIKLQEITHLLEIKLGNPPLAAEDKKLMLDSFYTIATCLKEIYLHSPCFVPYCDDVYSWKELSLAICQMSTLYLAMRDRLSGSKERELAHQRIQLMECVRRTLVVMNKECSFVIQFQLELIEEILRNQTLSCEEVIAPIAPCMQRVWQQLAFVFRLSLNNTLSKESLQLLYKNISLLALDEKENETLLNEQWEIEISLVEILRELNQKEKDPQKFFRLFTLLGQEGTRPLAEAADDFFLKRREFSYDAEKLYDRLSKAPLPSCWNDDLPCAWDNFAGQNYLYSTEFLKMVTAYVNNEEFLTNKVEKTVEVSSRHLIKLKESMAYAISKNPQLPYLEKIKIASEMLFDIPIKPSLSRYFYMVKDLSDRLGKKVALKIEGADLTLHPSKLSLINDSLTHILRNSIDHGIETPDERRSKGKEESGTIKIILREENDQIKLTVSDDGQGIDALKLKERAMERGLLTKEQLAQMGAVPLELVFLSGLSTREEATDISGRGIGMDVVKSNIEKMGGKVEVLSEIGKGSSFVIKVGRLWP
ncbi:MAG: Hpt domain-containing protein [Oligoflexia bacterium]|nr:Hpt domain-containing protein [Oligoflexia bacterium]MBF0365192.1 Hpt domain-containing protein [Oligoflexia bacterium]